MSARADFVDPLDLVDAERYGKRGYPHDVWTRLRAEAPLARLEPPGFEPFWAVTKHADVQHIAKDPLRFSSAGGITLRRAGAPLPPPTETSCRIRRGTGPCAASPTPTSRPGG